MTSKIMNKTDRECEYGKKLLRQPLGKGAVFFLVYGGDCVVNCSFCNLDFNKIENTIIYETESFRVIPSVGAFIDGYVLIVTKEHMSSLAELNDEQKKEYQNLVLKISEIFKKVYGKTPILFEHGTPDIHNSMSANSIIHAHSHIVNFKFENEKEILEKYNFVPIKSFEEVEKENYIYFQNGSGEKFVSYQFDSTSQFMRILIANEVNREEQYNWREFDFKENIVVMLEKIKKSSI